VFVVKDAQRGNLIDQVGRFNFCIVARDTQKNDETVSDLADHFLINGNFGARDALDHGSHYFFGGLLGRISTRLGSERSSCFSRSTTTRAMSEGVSCQLFSSLGESPPNSVFTEPGMM